MKKIREMVEKISEYLEVFLTVIILFGIGIASIQLLIDTATMLASIFDPSTPVPYEEFLGGALKLIIGLEFVNMLIRKTPEAVVEVLLFAIARKIVVGTDTNLGLVIGIGAIAVLFVVRRFLFYNCEAPKNHL